MKITNSNRKLVGFCQKKNNRLLIERASLFGQLLYAVASDVCICVCGSNI